MKYCKKCLEPSTRPNNTFNKDGICKVCEYYNSLKEVNCDERLEILHDLVSKYKIPKKETNFDCIIGVSGGKDSVRQALWARDKLGLKPLLVCLTYPPEQLTNIGAENISNLIDLGFDVHTVALAPETWKKLINLGFKNYVNICKSSELALFSTVPRLALSYKIPLVLWGENPGLQTGDSATLAEEGYDGNNLRNLNTLSGGDYQWMLDEGFSHKDLIGYSYPDQKEFENSNVQIIYLGWFMPDWSSLDNGLFSSLNGLIIKTQSPIDSGDISYVTSVDDDWVTFNQMIKYLKFGFGRATEIVNEEIRKEKISRDEGIDLVTKYDGKCNEECIESFCDYIKISKKEFWLKVMEATNKELFEISFNNEKFKAVPKFKVGIGL